MSQSSAYQTLASLAGLSIHSAKGLPAQVDVAPRWSGVGFSILGHHFVAPMAQVAELLELPSSTTPLPGVHPWVLGLSNVRGRLLPLIDLAHFFGGKITTIRKHQRVLSIEMGSLYTGLVVDRAYGMQHFATDKFRPLTAELPTDVQDFLVGEYVDDAGTSWSVFDISALVTEPHFTNAALL